MGDRDDHKLSNDCEHQSCHYGGGSAGARPSSEVGNLATSRWGHETGVAATTGMTAYNQVATRTAEEVHVRTVLAAGNRHSVLRREDGTVIATGNNQAGECDVLPWSDVIAVSAGSVHTARNTGKSHTVGLRADGTALATGWSDAGQTAVTQWREITAIAAG